MMKSASLVAILLAATCMAYAGDWKIVRGASKLEFTSTFEGSPVPGVFREFDVRVGFDDQRRAPESLQVVINVASADLAIPDVNKAIAGPEWFDFARFPKAEFQSTEIRRVAGNRYVARGTLVLKGVRQPVEVPFTWSRSPEGAMMDGELSLKRGAFAIGTGEWAAANVIGPDVQVKFHALLRGG